MIDRRGCLRAATHAANDSEWGYDGEMARDYLSSIDPDYDWDAELLEFELEEGFRTMGPRRPPSELELALMALYAPTVLKMLDPSPFVKWTVEDKDVSGGKFTIPLHTGRNSDV